MKVTVIPCYGAQQWQGGWTPTSPDLGSGSGAWSDSDDATYITASYHRTDASQTHNAAGFQVWPAGLTRIVRVTLVFRARVLSSVDSHDVPVVVNHAAQADGGLRAWWTGHYYESPFMVRNDGAVHEIRQDFTAAMLLGDGWASLDEFVNENLAPASPVFVFFEVDGSPAYDVVAITEAWCEIEIPSGVPRRRHVGRSDNTRRVGVSTRQRSSRCAGGQV